MSAPKKLRSQENHLAFACHVKKTGVLAVVSYNCCIVNNIECWNLPAGNKQLNYAECICYRRCCMSITWEALDCAKDD